MAQKTKIQYVGQFYVYGSEAPQIETTPKWTLPKLPRIRLEKLQRIYIDPVALGGLVVAVMMLVVLVIGAGQMKQTRAAYDQINTQLTELKRENARLSHTYHTGYDLDEIRSMADQIGMIPTAEADRYIVRVNVPAPKTEPNAWDNFVWFLSGLFENTRR